MEMPLIVCGGVNGSAFVTRLVSYVRRVVCGQCNDGKAIFLTGLKALTDMDLSRSGYSGMLVKHLGASLFIYSEDIAADLLVGIAVGNEVFQLTGNTVDSNGNARSRKLSSVIVGVRCL
jgi:hypothetical protein